MGLPGCSSFMQSAVFQSSPSSIFYSSFMFPSHRKVAWKKRASTIVSFWNGGKSADEYHLSSHRRVVLLMGISVLPFLQLIEAAAGEPEEEKMATRIQESQETQLKESGINSWDSKVLGREIGVQGGRENELEIKGQGSSVVTNFEAQLPMVNKLEIPSGPQNSHGGAQETTDRGSFVSFLNEIGIIGSGVFGALFAASQREKNALESTIDFMKTETKNQEKVTVRLKENFEATLMSEKEEHQRQLKMFKNEEASLLSQLHAAKDALTVLGRELQDEKKLAEELNVQRRQLENSLTQAREEKNLLEAAFHEKSEKVTDLQDKLCLLSLEINEKEKDVQNLNSVLAERDSECKNLSSTLEQARSDLAAANSSMEQLKEDNLKSIEESNSKGSIIDDLHAKIKSLTEEKDEYNSKFSDLMKDYDDMITLSERTAVHNSEVLSEKNEHIQQLEENLKYASREVSCKQAIISELTRERDDASALLEKERTEILILTNELQSARELLAASKAEASHIFKELMEAKIAYEEIMSKFLAMQDEYDQARQFLNSNLEQAKATFKVVSDKLESAKVVLRSTEEELVSASIELKTVLEERECLKKELVDTYKKVETTTNLLKEERKIIADLNKELELLRHDILKDSEARKSLEADLDEATRSLDEMNKSALLLSRELENTNSRNCSLETEKEILYNSLVEQKNIAKEARENIDDARNFISRLGSEKEKLEKRSKRFEEELAAAKGEILRLRRKIGVGQESMTELQPKSIEVPAGTPFSVKRTANRRKKRAPGSDDSL